MAGAVPLRTADRHDPLLGPPPQGAGTDARAGEVVEGAPVATEGCRAGGRGDTAQAQHQGDEKRNSSHGCVCCDGRAILTVEPARTLADVGFTQAPGSSARRTHRRGGA